MEIDNRSLGDRVEWHSPLSNLHSPLCNLNFNGFPPAFDFLSGELWVVGWPKPAVHVERQSLKLVTHSHQLPYRTASEPPAPTSPYPFSKAIGSTRPSKPARWFATSKSPRCPTAIPKPASTCTAPSSGPLLT